MKYRQKEVVMKGYESPHIDVKTVWSDGTADLTVQVWKNTKRGDVSTSTWLQIPLTLDSEELACVARTMARTIKHIATKSAERHEGNLDSIEKELS